MVGQQYTKVVQILMAILKDFGAQQKWMIPEHTLLDLEIGDIVVKIALVTINLLKVKTTDFYTPRGCFQDIKWMQQ